MGMPLLLLVTCRGYGKARAAGVRPGEGFPDRPHLVEPGLDSVALMTEQTLRAWGIPFLRWEDGGDLAPVRGAFHLAREGERPVAVLVDTALSWDLPGVAPILLQAFRQGFAHVLTKDQLLLPLLRLRTSEVVVTCMSATRPWGRLSRHGLDFASADSAMGHTADLALGIALAQPGRKVICLNGDGSMLMTLGTLVTIVSAGAENLILFVLENGTYEITGNQPIPGAGRVNFPGLARAAGFPAVFEFEDAESFESSLADLLAAEGPVFVSVRMEAGSEGPISRSEAEEAPYLKRSLAESSRLFRGGLS